jgi:antitoxin HicB
MKDLQYYMSLAYPVEITKIAQVEGGGYLARIPLLKGCLSDGETVEEALINIEEAKREWLAATLKTRRIIPEPVDESRYSGKFTLRLPKFLHKKLAEDARKEDMSLNSYILSLLSVR